MLAFFFLISFIIFVIYNHIVMEKPMIKTINEYISQFPEEVQLKLNELKATIIKAAPQAEECINYQMPTFKLNGNLVHFAAYKNHIGFYPTPSAIDQFKKELSVYKGAKGSVQFPIDKALPLSLITKIVEFRVKENLKKVEKKRKPNK
jgi:uncharacterized protein YdhG (YjbR/CyaY superfamily)